MPREYKSKKKTEFEAIASASSEIGNRPPQAPEIEEAVIGAMMVDEDCVHRAMEFLQERSFYDPKMRLIFQSISRLFKDRSAVDIMTVTERLRQDGKLDEVGGVTTLASLSSQVGSAANIEYYIRILQQKTIQRDLIAAAYSILKNAFDPTFEVDKLITDSQEQVFQAAKGSFKKDFVQIGDAVNRSLERIGRMQQQKGMTGVPSGFPTLDNFTMGWQPGNLIIIGARPSVGKTAFALNMARNAAVDHNRPTAFFSLEMTDVELADRLIAAESGIPSDKLKGRLKLEDHEWTQMEQALTRLVKAPLYIDETSGLHITEFKSKALRLKREKNIEIIFIDYLQLMEATVNVSGGAGQVQKITEISKQLKAAAKELGIPIIALSQLNRNPMGRMGSNGRPILSDLKDSGSIEQDADMVLFVHRPGMYGLDESPEAYTKAEIIIAKHRAGKIGNIEMTFNGDQVKFIDVANSLERYADRLHQVSAPAMTGGQDALSDWDRMSGAVGSYDPFSSFDNRYPAEY